MRNTHVFIIIICTILGTMMGQSMLSSCHGYGHRAELVSNEGIDSIHRITLLFAGDMMQHGPQINAAADGKGGYSYDACFENVSDEIVSADVAIANLEVTLAGRPYSGYPQFCAPDEFAAAIKNAGFDILLTSNNHSCDTGRRGLGRTLMVLDSLGIPHLGTYHSADDRSSSYPYLITKNGFRIALLAYTYGTNGLPVPSPYIVNLIDTLQMATDIKKAKLLKPDVIIAFMHWGIEYELHPNQEQRVLADWLINHGVDHVIGGHPHVVQPVEMLTDNDGNKHLVAWSLGNFISNQYKPTTTGGLMVKLTLQKDSTVRMENASYSMVWVSRPVFSGRKNYVVFPADVPDSTLNATERNRREEFINSIKSIFTEMRSTITYGNCLK